MMWMGYLFIYLCEASIKTEVEQNKKESGPLWQNFTVQHVPGCNFSFWKKLRFLNPCDLLSANFEGEEQKSENDNSEVCELERERECLR